VTTLVCGIDGCEHSTEMEKRGYQRMGLHRLREHGLKSGTAPRPRRLDGEGEGETIHVEPDGDTPAEIPPAESSLPETAPKRRSWRERFRHRNDAKASAAPSSTRERAPRRGPRGKRIPLDTDIADAWAFFGRRLEGTPHYPTGRMLTYQAPGAGVILDRTVAGTLVDTVVLQPLARSRDKYEDAAFLIAGPLVTFAITRSYQQLAIAMEEGDNEQAAFIQRRLQMQFEGFDWLLNAMLPRLAEGKKLAQEKEKRTRAVIADAFPELAGTGISPAEALRDMLFAPPTFSQGGTGEGTSDPAQNGSGPDSVAEREPASGRAESPA
jgi:hypothetical protein